MHYMLTASKLPCGDIWPNKRMTCSCAMLFDLWTSPLMKSLCSESLKDSMSYCNIVSLYIYIYIYIYMCDGLLALLSS